MKNKGFTLVELLGVIVILAILAGIAVPVTTGISTTIRTKSYCTKIDNLLTDAENYYGDYIEQFTDTCFAPVKVSALIDSGYVKEDGTINPLDNSSLKDKEIRVYKKNNRLYAYWADASDTTYTDSCLTQEEKDGIVKNRPTFKETDICNINMKSNVDPNAGSTVKIEWQPGSGLKRGSDTTYFNLSLNAAISGGAVMSAKYCFTSDENCTPDQNVSTPGNTISIAIQSKPNVSQKVCMKVTSVTGDLSNIVCSDSYIVDSTPIKFIWGISSVTVGTNGWDKALTLKGTVTGAIKAKYCVKANGNCTPDTDATISNNIINVPVFQNFSAQTACAQITDQYNYSPDIVCTTPTTYKVDSSSPTVTVSALSSVAAENGWYKSVIAKANISDSISGVSSSKYCSGTGACTPATAAALSGTTYTFNLNNGGNQEGCANATDVAGNTSNAQCTSPYYIDNIAPQVTGLTVSSSESTVSASMSASDNASGIWYYIYQIDGGGQLTSTASSYNFTGISDGSHTVYVWARDWAGNISAVSTANITVVTLHTLHLDFNNASDLSNYFDVEKYRKYDTYDWSNTYAVVQNGQVYFYEGYIDTHVQIKSHSFTNIRSIDFSMDSAKLGEYSSSNIFWDPDFELVFSNGQSILVYPIHYSVGWTSYLPAPEYPDGYVVVNNVNGTKTRVNNKLGFNYYQYHVEINDSNNLTINCVTCGAGYNYTTSVPAGLKITAINFQPTFGWWDKGNYGYLDWVQFTYKNS